jgi:hypothetical protein
MAVALTVERVTREYSYLTTAKVSRSIWAELERLNMGLTRRRVTIPRPCFAYLPTKADRGKPSFTNHEGTSPTAMSRSAAKGRGGRVS